MDQLDVMQLLVARDVGAKSTANLTGTAITTYDVLKDGELVITNSHNVVIGHVDILTNDLVAKYGFKFILRKGTTLVHSDLIKTNNIRSCSAIANAAAAAQLSWIGYNGTSGAIEANDNSAYVVRFDLYFQDRAGQGQQLILDGVYKSGTSAKASDITIGLVQSLDNKFSRANYTEPIVVNAVCNAAVTAANCFTYDTTVVNGSNVIAVATGLVYDAAGASTLAVGDYIRLGGPSDSTTALTDSVYEVKEINTLNVTLDRPVKEASGTYAAAGDEAEVIPAATGDAASWGIRCTGQTRTFDVGKFKDSIVTFTVGLNDSFGATTVNYATAASKGIGTTNSIKQLEYELSGNVGLVYKADFLQPSFTYVADHTAATQMYQQIAISWYDDKQTNAVDVSNSAKQLILASALGYATGEPFDLVADALEALGWTMDNVQV